LKSSTRENICPSCKKRKIQKNHSLCNQCHSKIQSKQFNAWSRAIYKIEQLNNHWATNCLFPPDFNNEQLNRWERARNILIGLIEDTNHERR
jgi:hypothetical protein